MSNIDQPINVSAPADAVPQNDAPASAPVEGKGKGKVKADDAMDEDEDEEDEDDEDEEDDDNVEEDDEMEGEEDFTEIDAGAILPQGRRTRGVKVDYTSAEALKKAGLENGETAKEDEDEEFVTKDNGVKAD